MKPISCVWLVGFFGSLSSSVVGNLVDWRESCFMDAFSFFILFSFLSQPYVKSFIFPSFATRKSKITGIAKPLGYFRVGCRSV